MVCSSHIVLWFKSMRCLASWGITASELMDCVQEHDHTSSSGGHQRPYVQVDKLTTALMPIPEPCVLVARHMVSNLQIAAPAGNTPRHGSSVVLWPFPLLGALETVGRLILWNP